MNFTDRMIEFPCLEQVIDRSPLTVTPNTSVLDAIELMNKARGNSCQLPNSNSSPDLTPTTANTTSCVLVVEGKRLLGVFTERDVVKHTTLGTDLSKVAIAEVMTGEVITFTESDADDLFTALHLLRQHQISHLPVLNQQGQVLGIFTPERMRQLLHPATLLKFWRVCEVMTTEVIHAPPTASVLHIAQLMIQHNVSCVAIAQEGKSSSYQVPIGIITERDIVQFQVLGLDLAAIEARTVMSAPLFCLKPDDSVWLAHEEMQRRRLRRMVVVGEEGELRGILTQTNYLQVFDPIEMLTVNTVLQQKIAESTTKLTQVNERLQQEVLEKRRMEELLLQSRIELEKRVEERTAEIIERNAQLQVEMMQRQQIEPSLRESETYRLLFENNPQPMWVYDVETLAFLAVNQAAIQQYGYSKDEFLAMTIAEIRPPEDIPILRQQVATLAVAGYVDSGWWRHQKKDGTIIDVEVTSNSLNFLGKLARFVLVTDITERQQAEAALRQSEEKYRRICELTSDYIYSCYVTPEGAIIDEWTTPNLSRITGYSFEELPRGENAWFNVIYPEDLPAVRQFIQERIATNLAGSLEYRIVTKQKEIRWICDRIQPEWSESEGRVVRLLGATEDITKRKQAEEELRDNNERLNLALELAKIGSWDWNMLKNEIIWTPYHETIFGYEPGTPSRSYSDWSSRVYPEDLPHTEASIQSAIASRQNFESEYRIVWPDGSIHWVACLGRFDYNALEQPTRMVGVLYEISDRKIAEAALKKSQEQLQAAISELTASNKELEQFAYAASHDLQEPLRKINSFAELLAQDYRQQLDRTADKYIDYITNGVSRMQALIEDLLIYSRVGRVELNKQPTDLNTVVSQVQIDLGVAIAENNAIITTTPLPTLPANPVQMAQLFQNLIANGIKFRREVPPEIHIAATLQQKQWLISVQDNGIGIKSEYIDRIFAIFQRLHSRSRYPGNGIGLALCRKIIERHGGRIWVESEIGKGTIFYCTIPA